MKKGIKLGSLLIIIALTLTPISSDAFNPLAHIHIADIACPDCSPKIDYYYGSIAPDIAWSIADLGLRLVLGTDTHNRDLSSFAVGTKQEAFARGWLTHSENADTPGADYFAHIAYTRNGDENPSFPGYVIEKADLLIKALAVSLPELELTPEFAHYVIEATIDLLLKEVDPTLPGKLFFANLFRSWQDRNLMMKVYVWSEGMTDWLTWAMAELNFRQLVNKYAIALMLPAPKDRLALAQLAKELASEMFDLEITVQTLLEDILPIATDLCEEDYYDVIEEAIDAIYSP